MRRSSEAASILTRSAVAFLLAVRFFGSRSEISSSSFLWSIFHRPTVYHFASSILGIRASRNLSACCSSQLRSSTGGSLMAPDISGDPSQVDGRGTPKGSWAQLVGSSSVQLNTKLEFFEPLYQWQALRCTTRGDKVGGMPTLAKLPGWSFCRLQACFPSGSLDCHKNLAQ